MMNEQCGNEELIAKIKTKKILRLRKSINEQDRKKIKNKKY